MEIRFLDTDEYHLLDQMTEAERTKLAASNSIVVAAVQDGKVKGHLVAMSFPHIEGAWIDPEIRGGIAGARMEALLIKRLKDLGASVAIAFAVNEKMESYVQRLGYKRVATAWKKEL